MKDSREFQNECREVYLKKKNVGRSSERNLQKIPAEIIKWMSEGLPEEISKGTRGKVLEKGPH